MNLVEYALGGDAAVADGGGFAPVVEFFGESLQITAQIRNDPGIGVEALATGDLAAGWSSSGVHEVVGMDQSGVPPGFVRRAWTVDAAGEPRYFLRLGVTLLPEAGILE